MKKLLLTVATCIVTTLTSSCGILIGSVKPIDEKSEKYSITKLTDINSDWIEVAPIEVENTRDSTLDNNQSDLIFQSKSTASIISLNSACRKRYRDHDLDLRQTTTLLLTEFSKIESRNEKKNEISSIPALETTIEGDLHGELMVLRAVVLRHKSCLYDLVFLARPKHFKEQEKYFEQFVTSLNLN